MDKETMTTMMSSEKQDWETPQELFDFLNDIFGFRLDVAADEENAKCEKYIDEEKDGLKTGWGKSMAWCNPPYGRKIKRWTDKAYSEAQDGHPSALLVPARTETRWFQTLWQADCLVFIKGRIKFVGSEEEKKAGAPFPSVLAVFGRKVSRSEKNKLMEIGQVVEPWVPRGVFGGKK